ncbi:MAG: zf-TFIIB domain-containing protein [Alphaproteobacteria bacterium]|nr:zf-TFIIB domain-containing protein [Alphaproteobacteria bacterium]
MPLLVCPNDDAAMQTIKRSGVEFDFCPTCRGVWLDRGELEKLMSAARDVGGDEEEPDHGYSRPAAPPAGRSAHDRRWDDDAYRGKKRRGFDIFDIFD